MKLISCIREHQGEHQYKLILSFLMGMPKVLKYMPKVLKVAVMQCLYL